MYGAYYLITLVRGLLVDGRHAPEIPTLVMYKVASPMFLSVEDFAYRIRTWVEENIDGEWNLLSIEKTYCYSSEEYFEMAGAFDFDLTVKHYDDDALANRAARPFNKHMDDIERANLAP